MTTHEIYALLMGVGIGTIFGVALSVSMRSSNRHLVNDPPVPKPRERTLPGNDVVRMDAWRKRQNIPTVDQYTHAFAKGVEALKEDAHAEASDSDRESAIAALRDLGYSKQDANRAVVQCEATELEGLIKESLGKLSKKGA